MIDSLPSEPRFSVGSRVHLTEDAHTERVPFNTWFTVIEVKTTHRYKIVVIDGLTFKHARWEPEEHLTGSITL